MIKTLPRAVIFDWDHTLVNNWGAIADAINVTRSHFGQAPWTQDQVIANGTRSARESFPDWYGDRAEEAINIFYSRFEQVQMSCLKPMPGAEALLQWLSAQTIPALVVSNKNGDYLRREAAALKWEAYFAALVGATDAAVDKPAREPVDHALESVGLKAGPEIWFVGDSEVDVLCAWNASCTSVLVGNKDPVQKWGANMSVTDCDALLALLCARHRAIA
jgi:phosphoglycolate phosphatase